MNATAAHAAFVAARRAYIGGTDIAAITGLSPWGSPLSVFLDKTAPELAEHKDSLIMRRGLALEDFISLNAAAILVVTDKAADLREGVAISRRLMASGAAIEKLAEWKKVQQR